jgi:uncharacterized protein YndB with AHSA1/START domain
MNIDGEWINQNGSTVTFEQHADGTLSGTYRSRKGRGAVGNSYALTGHVNGELVAFQVDWRDNAANLHAITSFTGRLGREVDGRTVLHTVWVLARQFEDEARTKPTQVWNAFLTNSDIFHRLAE